MPREPEVFDFPPGCVYVSEGRKVQDRWRESDLIRWEQGLLVPIGGWDELDPPMGGWGSPIRALHSWSAVDGSSLLAVFCDTRVWFRSGEMAWVNISPDTAIVGSTTRTGGYGEGDYGTDDTQQQNYGSPRTPSLPAPRVRFSIDNWGEDLLVMSSADGRLLYYDLDGTDGKLVPVAAPDSASWAVPENSFSFAVTPERHVMLFGQGGNPSEIAWSDVENFEGWDFTDTEGQAGFLPIEPRSPIIAHAYAQNRLIIWTERQCGAVNFVGGTFIYSYELLSESLPPVSSFALVPIYAEIMWLAEDGFWLFNGVSVEPLLCDVWGWIKENVPVLGEARAVHHSTKSEVWFFFGGGKYVSYDYRTRVWMTGHSLDRLTGILHDKQFLMADEDEVYVHELPGVPSTSEGEYPWVETGLLSLGAGRRLITVNEVQVEKQADASVGVVTDPIIMRETDSEGIATLRHTAEEISLRIGMTGEIGLLNAYVTPRGRVER